MIIGKDMSKIYGYKVKYTAVDNINIEVEKGDFIAIMGPSGSGKTTCLNLLSTVDSPTIGQVYIENKRVKALKNSVLSRFRYENIGYIFQEFNLLNNLTVRDNIGVPLLLEGISRKKIKEEVEEVAKMLHIEELLRKKPMECSGGQRQRIAIARALVNKPKLIVADEPTANLDTKNSNRILNTFRRLNKEGITVIMVTHDNLIASYSSRLLYIRDGKVEETIHRGEKEQREYFYEIVGITSKENADLFENII